MNEQSECSMSQQSPHHGADASSPADFTPEMGLRMWYAAMEACDELLRAGLRHQIGPDGDFEAAYRRWHEERYAEHERGLLRMAEQLNKVAEHASPPGS
jgi:hypothetical protein